MQCLLSLISQRITVLPRLEMSNSHASMRKLWHSKPTADVMIDIANERTIERASKRANERKTEQGLIYSKPM